jgi:NADH:ubiquinone oxidoreductase subunit 4 (subunit M)
MYTSVLSFILFIALLFIYYWLNTFDYLVIKHYIVLHAFQIDTLHFQLFWTLSIIAFFAKLPIFPFHIWLPEAHVEAPTVGSVILASILLKIGAYAIIRFLLPFQDLVLYNGFSVADGKCFVLIKLILWISLLYTTIIIVSQVDLKKIIAYSSIIHMSLSMIGFFSQSTYGVHGGYLMLFAHGFSSAGLFFIAGMLYSRFGTRLLKYYSGLHLVARYLSFFAVFFFLADGGFGGCIDFWGGLGVW